MITKATKSGRRDEEQEIATRRCHKLVEHCWRDMTHAALVNYEQFCGSAIHEYLPTFTFFHPGLPLAASSWLNSLSGLPRLPNRVGSRPAEEVEYVEFWEGWILSRQEHGKPFAGIQLQNVELRQGALVERFLVEVAGRSYNSPTARWWPTGADV